MSRLSVDAFLTLTSGSKADGRMCIFVAGAANSMGRAACKLFQARGWFIGAYDLDRDALTSLVEELGAKNCVAGILDTTDIAAVHAAVAHFGERTNFKLDLAYNSAGYFALGDFGLSPYNDHHHMVQVNAMGAVNFAYAVLPLLKNTMNSLLFLISSSAAIRGAPGFATYAATKGFVRLLTESLSAEWAIYQVRAADVHHAQPSFAQQEKPMKSRADFGEIAETVWQCYHEAGTSPKIHWYVPKELEEEDRKAATDREIVRDTRVRQLQEYGQDGSFNPILAQWEPSANAKAKL